VSTPRPRREQLADAAITVLAESGLRGLTHRQVDAVADAPLGTTSNHARTRVALMVLALRRVVELDEASPSLWPSVEAAGRDHGTADAVFTTLALAIHDRVRESRPRLIARYELALEATRVPELRVEYDREGAAIRSRAAGLLSAMGVEDAPARARVAVAVIDGFLFDAMAGAGSRTPTSADDLAASLRRSLGGLLLP